MDKRRETTAFLRSRARGRASTSTVALLALLGGACAKGDINLGLRGEVIVPVEGGAGPVDADGGGQAIPDAQADGGPAPDNFADAAGLGSDAGADAMAADGAVGPLVQISSGCGSDPPATDTSIAVSGMTGSYILDLPAGYDKRRAYPLLMAFRGASVTAGAFRGYLDILPSVGADAIVVHPDCLNDASTWDVKNDLLLFDALLQKMAANYCIDELRVFAVGHGTGGVFTNTLGCLRGNKLRAIAPLAPGPPPVGACQEATAVWMIQGKRDSMLNNGRASRDFWLQQNHCDSRRTVRVGPDDCEEYGGCDVGAVVRYCEFDGDLNLPGFAADGAWQFFRSL